MRQSERESESLEGVGWGEGLGQKRAIPTLSKVGRKFFLSLSYWEALLTSNAWGQLSLSKIMVCASCLPRVPRRHEVKCPVRYRKRFTRTLGNEIILLESRMRNSDLLKNK